MSAKVIDFMGYKQANQKTDEYANEYGSLRDLMVLLFGELDHIPEEAPAIDSVDEHGKEA